MVEMTEMANILRNATQNSLVLVDEIGRGTSTYDGLSLAWACALDLAQRLQAFSLFATHYFEITELAEQLKTVNNVHLDAVEHGQDLTTAQSKLEELESSVQASNNHQHSMDFSAPTQIPVKAKTSAVEDQLSNIDPDSLNARQALDLIYELKTLLK